MPDSDPFDLQRFVDAQADIYERALAELREGRKRSHWMWFMFPQIDGLGHSTMAQTYAIRSLAEARAYLAHPVLGARLQKCTEAVLAVAGKSAHAIFGSPDDLKFHSSMTLFAHAAPNESLFRAALVEYFDGQDDQKTTSRI
ncbi:MAG TPA: DUF1810 domain-containing protein [Rhizomicrobium sp.]|nr:DUF1810 domain-containing protein [Rhizomicrobium sp.]